MSRQTVAQLLCCWWRSGLLLLLLPLSCATYALNNAASSATKKTSFFDRLLVSSSPQQRQREELKSELLELVSRSSPPGNGGRFATEDDRLRFEELFNDLLPALNPTFPNSARSVDLFSGEWECKWTDEKELNFLVGAGLFGEKWKRTYQVIDVRNQRLENTLLFGDGSSLWVKSTLVPDEEKGSRFNIEFYEAALKWRSFEIPIPPIGSGWGELLYLDGDMRLQRDIRGDRIVATKVKSIY